MVDDIVGESDVPVADDSLRCRGGGQVCAVDRSAAPEVAGDRVRKRGAWRGAALCYHVGIKPPGCRCAGSSGLRHHVRQRGGAVRACFRFLRVGRIADAGHALLRKQPEMLAGIAEAFLLSD